MIRYLLFDCDGVLVDSEIIAAKVLLRQLEPFGFQADIKPFMKRYAGMKDNEILEDLSRDHKMLLPDYFLHQLENAIDHALHHELQPIAGVQTLLQNLNLPKAVVSNSQLPRVQHSLNVAGVTHFFNERIYTAEMAGRPKPHPDPYLYALKESGIEAHEAIVVEDSPTGVTAARTAGLKVIGFVGASHITEGHAEKLLQCGASDIADSMEALLPLLQRRIETIDV